MAGRGTDIKLGEGVKEVGGLKIIGTERHESRRIDNQLRGRAGRQGDVGTSRFFIAMEDDIMRLFGSERYMGFAEKMGLPEDQPLETKMLSGAIENEDALKLIGEIGCGMPEQLFLALHTVSEHLKSDMQNF